MTWKKTVSTDRFFYFLFGTFILTFPLNQAYEVIALLKGQLGWKGWSVALSPTYIKAIKDVFLILFILISFVKLYKNWSVLKKYFYSAYSMPLNIFILSLIIYFFFEALFGNKNLAIYGLRGYWNIFYVLVGVSFYKIGYDWIVKFIKPVFSLHLILQIYQYINNLGFPLYGEDRSPGIFVVPATAGVFSLLCIYIFHSSKNKTFLLLSLASLYLSNSTAGLIALIAALIIGFQSGLKNKVYIYPSLAIIVSIISFFIYENIGVISGRGDAVYQSFGVRLGYITAVLSNYQDLLFGKTMGIATSQAVMLDVEGAIVADNTFTGVMLNMGIIPALSLLFFFFSLFKTLDSKIIYFGIVAYSMTTVFMEINPVVQIYMYIVGVDLMRKISSKSGGI